MWRQQRLNYHKSGKNVEKKHFGWTALVQIFTIKTMLWKDKKFV
jgi:hypothetical protein